MSIGIAERYDVSAISCGRDQTLALLANGKVIGWGSEGSGRIPSGQPEYCTTPAPTRPVEVLLREPLKSVAAGYGVSLGVTARREVTVWGAQGAGVDGRLGAVAAGDAAAGRGACRACATSPPANSSAPRSTRRARSSRGASISTVRSAGPTAAFESPPGRVPGLPAMRDIALGMGYMLALTQDREVLCVGRQCGRAARPRTSFERCVAVAACKLPHRVDAIAAGDSHALALTTTDEVLAWGSNNHGQLGRDAPAYSTAPIAVRLAGARAGGRRRHVLLAWRSATAAACMRGAGTATASSGCADRGGSAGDRRSSDGLSERPRDRGRTGARRSAGRATGSTDGAPTPRASSAAPRRSSTVLTSFLRPGSAAPMADRTTRRSHAPRFPEARRDGHRRRVVPPVLSACGGGGGDRTSAARRRSSSRSPSSR